MSIFGFFEFFEFFLNFLNFFLIFDTCHFTIVPCVKVTQFGPYI